MSSGAPTSTLARWAAENSDSYSDSDSDSDDSMVDRRTNIDKEASTTLNAGPSAAVNAAAAAGPELDPSLVVPAKRKRKPRPKLTPGDLVGSSGVSVIADKAPYLGFKGHEASDLRKLVSFYREWAYGMFPHLCLEDIVDESRTWPGSVKLHGALRLHLEKLRDDEYARRTGIQRRPQPAATQPPSSPAAAESQPVDVDMASSPVNILVPDSP